MATHSQELRERVWEALEQGASSCEVAEQFSVPESWVRTFRQQVRQRGHLLPLRRGGHRQREVDEAGEACVRQWVREQPQVTLRQLAERLREQVGRLLSEATMSRVLKRLGITKKKDAWRLPSVKSSRLSKHAKGTSSKA